MKQSTLLFALTLALGALAVGCDKECVDVNGKKISKGQTYKPDSCNTCTCNGDGTSACTQVQCLDDLEDGALQPPACTEGGKGYAVGQSFPSSDGCNTCSCNSDGSIVCTQKGCAPAEGCTMGSTVFAPGQSVVCADGCNTCTCAGQAGQPDSFRWAQTKIGCPPVPAIERCAADSAGPVTQARVLYLKDDLLAVEVTQPGCATEGQKFKLCYDGAFLESFPVQTGLKIVSETTPTCSSMPTGSRVFSLKPLAELYKSSYQATSGQIDITVQQGGRVSYKF